MMKTKFAIALLLIIPCLLIPDSARADGIIIPDPPVCIQEPCPPFPNPVKQLEIRYHHVDVVIDEQIAVTRVDQVFRNPNDWTVEGVYIFPIPLDAAVTDFTLWMDGEPVQGEILSAEEARRTYEGIIREMQDPALLEYADRGAVKARIFPISPGEERRIQLEYAQVLTAEGGLVRYVYPLNTEKFSTQPLEEVRVGVDLRSSQPIRAVYSPSHPIDIRRDDDFHVKVGFEQYDVKPDTDFALFYSIGESEALHLLSYRDLADPLDLDGFFLLLLAPRPDKAVQAVPKDVILVLDRSGSMEGEKFMQAQQALKYILTHLNPEDRFNLISFSTDIETYAQNLRDRSEINAAVAWVDRQSAVGSTDINRALLEAAAMADPERPTYLIFLTDGLPTEGVVESEQILKNFHFEAPKSLRMFSFGVGYDVDTFLLDSLAQEHHGTSTYVLPNEALDEILSSFYAKVSIPVLMDLQLDFGELVTHDLYPNPLPDLFSGSQIVVIGRYHEGGQTEIKLTGTVNSQTQTFTYSDQDFASETTDSNSQSSIPRLWATRKIGFLLNQIRLNGPDQELVDQIVKLSIRYGIVTPYTSYLVTEPLPLGVDEQNRIAEETFNEMITAPAAPSFGQKAVEQAAGEGALRDADSISPPTLDGVNEIRNVRARTFVFSGNHWVDTTFDPDRMQTIKIAFLSDNYFALTESDPQLAAAFALGQNVIAISDGNAYQVVPADYDMPMLDNSDIQSSSIPSDKEPTATALSSQSATSAIVTPDASTIETSFPCLGGLLPLAFFPLIGFLSLPNCKE